MGAHTATTPVRTRAVAGRRRGAAAVAAFMAFWAYAGAVGLVGGGIDFGATITRRLPFHNPVLGGLALVAWVAVPMTAAAVAAWRGHPLVPGLLVVAGLLLVAWIAVEVAFVRTFSWMQPACVGYGLLVVWLGWRAARPR